MKEPTEYTKSGRYQEDIESWVKKHGQLKYIINGKKYYIN